MCVTERRRNELDGDKRRSAVEMIRKARAKVIREAGAPLVHPREGAVVSSQTKLRDLRSLCKALFRTRTGDPLLTMEVLYQLS
jgi:hypothetical protein